MGNGAGLSPAAFQKQRGGGGGGGGGGAGWPASFKFSGASGRGKNPAGLSWGGGGFFFVARANFFFVFSPITPPGPAKI